VHDRAHRAFRAEVVGLVALACDVHHDRAHVLARAVPECPAGSVPHVSLALHTFTPYDRDDELKRTEDLHHELRRQRHSAAHPAVEHDDAWPGQSRYGLNCLRASWTAPVMRPTNSAGSRENTRFGGTPGGRSNPAVIAASRLVGSTKALTSARNGPTGEDT
jgi:hypothetical protein